MEWIEPVIGPGIQSAEVQDLLNVVSIWNVIKDSDCVQQARLVVCQTAERVLNPKHQDQT
jgi:hypothetical protein